MRDLAQLFQAKTMKVVEDTTKKLKIVEHLQVRLLLKLNRRRIMCLVLTTMKDKDSIL